MKISFSDIPLQLGAFCGDATQFMRRNDNHALGRVLELIAIETGDRCAREAWQHQQLNNLVQFCRSRSKYLENKLKNYEMSNPTSIKLIEPSSRVDIRRQVAEEGCLLHADDKIKGYEHFTSGSSGIPLKFYVSDFGAQYNGDRSIATYFIENRDFKCNRTQLKQNSNLGFNGVVSHKVGGWAGALGDFIRTGSSRVINYLNPDPIGLGEELLREPVGYLIVQPWVVELLLKSFQSSIFKKSGIEMWIPIGGYPDVKTRKLFTSANIPIRATYSCEEVGKIGDECSKFPGTYHVATSNVIVEVLNEDEFIFNNVKLGKVLVTHLHSYATPFIRYDLGDYGVLNANCKCGFDGPVISNIVGRGKNLFKKRDGSLAMFHVQVKNEKWLARFSEYRFIQKNYDEILIEVSLQGRLGLDDENSFRSMIAKMLGDNVRVEIRAVDKINWGAQTKRLVFSSEVT
jgi:phenylacetate-CoA ligase